MNESTSEQHDQTAENENENESNSRWLAFNGEYDHDEGLCFELGYN